MDALVVEIVAGVSIHLFSLIMQIGLIVTNGLRWGHEFVLATDRAPADNIEVIDAYIRVEKFNQ